MLKMTVAQKTRKAVILVLNKRSIWTTVILHNGHFNATLLMLIRTFYSKYTLNPTVIPRLLNL